MPTAPDLAGNWPLHGHDLDGLLQTLQGIAARRRTKFVRDVASVSEIGDGFGNEPVIQLLSFVEFMPVRHASGVKMPDPLKIRLDVARHVAIHDLEMVDVAKYFDSR